MPMLLEDLAEETSASNRRAADRLEAEAKNLDELRRADQVLEELPLRAVEAARQATEYAISGWVRAEAVWRLAVAALSKRPVGPDAERLLGVLLALFESGERLIQ